MSSRPDDGKRKTPEEEGFEPVEFVPVLKPDVETGSPVLFWIEVGVVLLIFIGVVLVEIDPFYRFIQAVLAFFR